MKKALFLLVLVCTLTGCFRHNVSVSPQKTAEKMWKAIDETAKNAMRFEAELDDSGFWNGSKDPVMVFSTLSKSSYKHPDLQLQAPVSAQMLAELKAFIQEHGTLRFIKEGRQVFAVDERGRSYSLMFDKESLRIVIGPATGTEIT